MELKELYLLMYKIRKFEEKLIELYSSGKLKGTTHLSIGQESCAVGVCSALSKKDLVSSTHRGHGHYIAKGGDINRLMAEFFGKKDGLCGGRGGSQHIFDIEIGFLGANGITGGGLPIACGAAFKFKYKSEQNISVAFIGDGASNQGTFHEVLNIAAALGLPLLVIIENNGYAMFTKCNKTTSIDKLSLRSTAYGIKGETITHEDVEFIRKRVLIIKEEIIRNRKPFILEIKTFRQCGHSKSDDCSYMSYDEKKYILDNDVLINTRKKVLDLNNDENALSIYEKNICNEIEESVKFANKSEIPIL